jgi:lactoylglutathione lyase
VPSSCSPWSVEGRTVIKGVSKVVIEVDDQARALRFWTQTLGFEFHQDTPYGEERWVEVRTPDRALILVLSSRQGDRPSASDQLPTSNVFFYCDDLAETYEALRSRGVEFPQPPVELSFGWVVAVPGSRGKPLRPPVTRGDVKSRHRQAENDVDAWTPGVR